MRPAMSLDEFAELVDTPADEIRALTEEGLLDPAGQGNYEELDLLRLMTVRHYAGLGYDHEALATAIADGEVEPFLHEYIYPKGNRLSIEEAARQLEVEPELLETLRTALGFSRDTVLEGDYRLFEAFKVMSMGGLPLEAVVEGARVFGDSLRRLAETETRLVHVHVHERLEDEGADEPEIIHQIEGLQRAVIPLLDGIVQRVHHEHLLLASIEDAYVHLVDTEKAGGRGSVDATIAFVDVASFTQLAESEGDEAAMAAITHVDTAVRRLTLDHAGKVVKQIGDALMLAFRDSGDAVRFAAALERASRDDDSMPALRVGMHCGPAIYRAGDYLGNTVNIASRVAGQASAGETVMTEPVAERADGEPGIESVGVRVLRGVEKPLTLYRLRLEDEKVDPVCGKPVTSPPAARLQQDDGELWFCSKNCLRQHLAGES
jgi:adenylate cyclase